MSCRHWHEDLAESALGALEVSRQTALQAHLAQCAGCRVELESLQRTMAAVDARLPEPSAPGELNAWPAVEAALDEPPPVAQRPGVTLGYPLAAAAAVGLLVVGTWIGLGVRPDAGPFLPRSTTETTAAAAAESPAARLASADDADYVRYLERATPLLLALANRTGNGSMAAAARHDTGTEQALARKLALDAPELRRQLANGGRRREARLIENLEVVFLQVANLAPESYPDGLDMVQQTIAQREVLFQLTVEEMRSASAGR